MNRPSLPPQHLTKYKQSVQFPKCLAAPFRRLLVSLREKSGSCPLKTHVVVCGFPRSGSTLLQLMIEACVQDVRTYGRERRGMEAARCYHRSHPIMMTKRPSDIFTLDDLRAHYKRREDTSVRFVLMTRDPRAVLTSYHQAKPGDYYVPADRWRAIYSYWNWALKADDVMTIRYEDLICNPDRTQDALAEFTGWTVRHPFAEFHTAVPDGFDTRALNGVRKLDPNNAQRWREDKHRDKLVRLLTEELPELPQRLIELGYEQDELWTAEYLDSAHRKAA